MPEPIQHFAYRGPDAEGGRDADPGRKSFLMAMSPNVVSTVQVFQKGVGNKLHVHLTEDGYWLVLSGRARFHGEGETIIAELDKYQGVLIPAGTKYWFEGISDEPLEILRVNYRVRQGPRVAVDEDAVARHMVAAEAAQKQRVPA